MTATESISAHAAAITPSSGHEKNGSPASRANTQRHDSGKGGDKELPSALSSLAWADSSEASNDFRSDFFTKPTLPMLKAIINMSLGDGDSEEDAATLDLEQFVADLLGKEAALLAVSGTMCNQVALRAALTVQPYSILADHRAHITCLEGGGPAALCGAMIKTVIPSNGHHLTLDDFKRHAVLTTKSWDCPTRVISLENTLMGTVMPLSEMRAISQWARAQNPPIHMHLDEARLWEAASAGAFTFREAGQSFDNLQLCFTKGLGAPIGSIVVGGTAFIQRAKWSRRLCGGSSRASEVIVAPAKVAIETIFLGKQLQGAQDKARHASALWEALGGTIQVPTETNMLWFDLNASGLTDEDFYPLCSEFGIKVGEPLPGRVVFHHQITEDAFARLSDRFRAVFKERNLRRG